MPETVDITCGGCGLPLVDGECPFVCTRCRNKDCDIRVRECGLNPDDQLCSICSDEIEIDCAMPAAKKYAKANCRLTGTPTKYNPEAHFACTPEEYNLGDRCSHTENSCLTLSRHNATNYDELIRELDRYDPRDQAYRAAIRDRCNQLVCEAEPSLGHLWSPANDL